MTRTSPGRIAAAGCALAGAALAVLSLRSLAAGEPPPPPAVLDATAAAASAAKSAPATEAAPLAPMARVAVPPRAAVHGAHVRDADAVFDWNAIPAGETFAHVFVLHNDGDEVLHIVRAHPS